MELYSRMSLNGLIPLHQYTYTNKDDLDDVVLVIL